MRQIQRSALVPYSAEQMFDIVNNVARYQEFLPWCESSEILSDSDSEMIASVDLKAKGMRQSFTTRNTLDRPNSIKMSRESGILTSLQGEWQFKALGEDGCKISLDLSFDMPRSLSLVGGTKLFDQAADKMVEVFCARADQLYGGEHDR